MKNRIVVMLMAAVLTLPAMAQMSEQVSQASFQSTSAMQGSGSAYTSNPMLSSDGSAVYDNAASASPSRGPRKVGPDPDPTVDEKDKVPVGEPWVLLAMAAAAAATIAVRRRRAAGSSAGE